MTTVVVALDKFKGSVTAGEACANVCAGIGDASPDWHCITVPLADGGDGTVEVLRRAGWRIQRVETIDAQGEPVSAEIARDGDTAVIELANICGIARWRGELQPWRAHTKGLGIAIRQCIDEAEHIVVALGGSASTDGGLGLLQGLGFAVTDSDGVDAGSGLSGLDVAASIEFPVDIDELRSKRWTVLVDVDSPLCGPEGAARRFGPQKGLSEVDVATADEVLGRWNRLLTRSSGRDVGAIAGVGAAGGTAAPLVALLDARIDSGFEFIAECVDLRRHLDAADVVVTGEGRVDASSLSGKVVGQLLSMAADRGVAAIVVAGSIDEDVSGAWSPNAISLVDIAGSQPEAMAHPSVYLRTAGRLIGNAGGVANLKPV